MDPCVTCNTEVEENHRALRCDICNHWEHVGCVRQADRPSEALYTAVTECYSQSLLYVCSRCRRQGPVPKRLLQLELERARANDERLASARQLEEKEGTIAELRARVKELEAQQGTMQHEVLRLSQQLTNAYIESKTPTTVVSGEVVTGESTVVTQVESEPSGEESDSSEDGSSVVSRESRRSGRRVDPYPPGFRALITRVNKFSGDKGAAGDFEIWLEDFIEATGDCDWDDKCRAKWFSWFLTGQAKASWQHTLKAEDKAQWERIKEVFKGEYGIHLDPRTAYQRCHELRYEQFGSAQSLLTAMREYQRIAPHKLTDVCLESILWNKVPVELQKEVKEITTDGSVQELLQRLMRAEAVVQERKRRDELGTQEQRPREKIVRPRRQPEQQAVEPVPRSSNSDMGSAKSSGGTNGEMSLKAVKCFNCKKKGHLARLCPEPKRQDATRRINASETQEEKDDTSPWIRTVIGSQQEPLAMRGPTYKVPVVVNGIKTRALLDHGAQVSLVRKELLSLIKEKNQWTLSQCDTRSLKMDGQPIGAGGEALGAVAVVALDITVEKTEKSQQVPCYALASSKPIWKGELENCAVILGTNALELLGFSIVQSDGTTVKPEGQGNSTEGQLETTTTKVLAISLSHVARIGPQQTIIAKVRVDQDSTAGVSNLVGIVVPKEEVLSRDQCDFIEGLWVGQTEFTIPVTNWGTRPLILDQGSVVGHIEEAVMVEESDEIWEEEKEPTVRTLTLAEIETRREQLTSQLMFGDSCSKEEREALQKLLCSKHQVFALADHELGEVDLVEHRIEMTEHKPFRTPPRRLPYALRTELELELSRLMTSGCIEPSASPYASGLVLVRKKDGSLRVCVDYRGINKDTVSDCFPIPRIDDLIDLVGRRQGRVFTTLDLMKGYHQIRMHPDSKDKTAFTCHMGHFQYRRMPFGLTNAPATFQRLMNQLFCGKAWDFVFVYLDDLLIVSKSVQEHLVHLEKVLDRLDQAGLRLKPQKCVFVQQQVEYLGHTITPEGVRPNNKKIQAVKDFPRPKSSKEVKSFLGLVNFYRRHLPNFAAVVRPLTALTRHDKESKAPVPFEWSEDCETAFRRAKELLVTAPLLHPPDLAKEFFLWTDASGLGFGALLEQEGEDGLRHPVAYASRQTNAAEAKYAPTELEVAALVYAVNHFEVYLLGNDFTVYTDHQALVSAFIPHMKSQVKGLLARWYLRLSRFLPKMKLQYKPGVANKVADALSRAPLPGTSSGESQSMVLQVSQPELEPSQVMLRQVQEQQRQDPELVRLTEYLTVRKLPDDQQEAQVIMNLAKKGYFVVDGVLYHEGGDAPSRRRLVVPRHLREQIISEHHDTAYAGHFSVKKMTQRINQYYYWSGMQGDIHKKCAACVTCASVKGQGSRERPALVNIPVGGPFECIGMDFVELDRSHKGNRYALVMQDYLTKWPEVYALPDRKAETVARCLLDLTWKHGVPARIIHDRAAEFLAEVLQETATLLGVTQLPTSGGHPQTDGLVEQFNRTLKQMLTKLVKKGGTDWETLLGPVLFAYRTTPHSSTGMTPFYLLYGRTPELPSSLDFQQPVVRYPVVESEFAKELVKELKQARSIAQRNIQGKQAEQKKYYDQRTKINQLQEGDLVMLKTQPRFRLDRSFKGPFIVKTVTPTNAVIQLKGDNSGELINVSRQRLSKCSIGMEYATPWVGHSNKLRKRRQIRKRKTPAQRLEDQESVPSRPGPTTPRVTRSGRQVNQPARYLLVTGPKVSHQKRGEVVRTDEHVRQSHASLPPKKSVPPRDKDSCSD